MSFDPTQFHHFPHSPAFAAAVEQEYLSRVDILVTVGRGGFQQSIVDRFVKHSGKEIVYRICRISKDQNSRRHRGYKPVV